MILSVRDVTKSYGKDPVLKGVSFELAEAQITALVGPNGSGKSTLLNIIANLLPADTGTVTVLGSSNKDTKMFRHVSFMQDNIVLYDYLTGYDHLQFICEVQGLSEDQLLAAAERIGITSYLRKKVKNYSLGMKQHLLLAMAIVNQPKLLILDEPLNGLDPTSAIRVRELLLSLRAEGTTILLSSHNLAEIDRVTSAILFLKNGELIQEDLAAFEQIRYQITALPLEKALQTLETAGIPFEQADGNLRFLEKACTLDRVLQELTQQGVTIQDIDKNISGSEERYRMIFGGGAKADAPAEV
ncbi:ABC transporter ATP-binding protein [Sporosarcina trichiuri]|uniref:ABC transporter ATP-binding protein n=1 Tax=Sporosarcina trichiuri TaxID=3056445 RepID=UPI0025B5AEC2|nr:ABC transporter ATP-binding protein [Sporosarcina sp. 0.2-SM1T-5]WJY28305.1 ABC transporter ATP-binding protein [Sporosarcina sp. 0.2-SM1T-5]